MDHSGLNKMTPLRKLLLSQIEDNNWIERVTAEYNKGRRLFVGFTDLNSGNLYAVDMTRLAAAGSQDDLETKSCYADMLVASSSVPAYFDPVRATGKNGEIFTLVDGGVRAGSFITSLTESKRATMAAETPDGGPGALGATKAYSTVVINGPLEVCEKAGDGLKPGILSVAGRAVSVLIDQNINDSLARILEAELVVGDLVQYTAVSRPFSEQRGTNLCDFAGGTTSFNPVFQQALIKQAEDRWQVSDECAFGVAESCL